jgi:hypothetical protein
MDAPEGRIGHCELTLGASMAERGRTQDGGAEATRSPRTT